MGLLSGGMESLSLSGKAGRRSSDASGRGERPDGNENDTSELDKEEGNILGSIISQLRPGMDLSKIALPTFVLEPRSLLERITDFFSHPDLIFGAGSIEDEKERFLKVATYYLSGWHIKPKGVKKPYNPVLGEFFRCTYNYPDGSEGLYIAEQVSHHPPVSAFFYISPANGLLITGELKPKSKFLGNSAATIMEGEDRIRLLDRPQDGEYVITMPNTYARGILFGKMILELGDVSSIKNEELDYHCDVDFRTKGWISGGYNAIHGAVKGPDNYHVGDISGHWHDVIEYSDKRKGKSVMFDAKTAKNVPKSVLPEDQQEENESRRLWANLTQAIKKDDMHGATAAKSAVEDKQREKARQREASGQGHPEARFFRNVAGDRWMPKLDLDGLPQDRTEMLNHVKSWVFAEKAQLSPTSSTSPTSPKQPAASTTSVASAGSQAPAPPPSVPTAPGPPAPGPKATHPI